MMKVLFLIDNLGSGGAQRQVATLAPLMQARGIEIIVVAYFEQNFFAEMLKGKVPIVCIKRGNYISRTLAIRKYIRKENFDAVISFLDNPDFINCFAALGGKKWKVITSERSAKEEAFSTKLHRVIAWFKRYSDYIVCNSENAKNLWLKFYPQYEPKLKVIYNAVTIKHSSIQYTPKKEGKIHFVVAASIGYLKNPLNVIEAINRLGDLKSRLLLDWYGNYRIDGRINGCYMRCQELIKEYGLQDVVQFHEPTSEIAEIMQKADCIGLFSRIEGLPNAICEAMTLSKPIIMSRVSDYNKLIDKHNGFLCDWDDVDSIAEAFKGMIEKTKSDLLQMGNASKQKSEQLFSPDSVCEKWFELIAK